MDKLHHANVIVGKADYRDFVFALLARDLNFGVKANPDFLLVENQFFGIGDARNLKEWVADKPLVGEVKVSLIIVKSITHEAQNALLKVLEEPPAGTYIFINLESLGGLLPTFVSRVVILEPPESGVGNDPMEKISLKFLHSDIKNRLANVRALLKNEDKTDLKKIIGYLEKTCYQNRADKTTNDISKTMKNILIAKTFAAARGSSPKIILEWLAYVL